MIESISESQNGNLMWRDCHEEVKKVMFSMHLDKSSGPKCLHRVFFQAYWDVLGHDIMRLCDEFI